METIALHSCHDTLLFPEPTFLTMPHLKLPPSRFIVLMLSRLCDNNPCKAPLYREGLEGKLSVMSESLGNNAKRKHLYRCFIVGEYGTLGCNNRVYIPECVSWLSSVGHRDIGDGSCINTVESVHHDTRNKMFKS